MTAGGAKRALDHLRVIDMTQVIAGPYATMLLADMGADVIRVEPPDGRTRRHGRRLRGDDGTGFLALNRNKRSVALDLKSERDRAVCEQLIASADVFVENYRVGALTRLGLDWESLHRRDPELIYASVSGFGQTGPYADRPGYDIIAQDMSGLMSVTGEPGGPPLKCGPPVTDLAAGMLAANAILNAVIARDRGYGGQYVETSLFDAAVSMAVWENMEWWATGEVPGPLGSAHRANAPYQALRAADGYLTVGANTDSFWHALCQTLGREDLVSDERFVDNEQRLAHRDELVRELETALLGDTVATWVDRLLAAGVPAGPILDYGQVFTDPHTEARGLVQSVHHPVEGEVDLLGFPVKLQTTPAAMHRPPPLLGEHNAEVLAELDRHEDPDQPTPGQTTPGRTTPDQPTPDRPAQGRESR